MMIITINGADGSGKSTIIKAIAEVTNNSFTHFHSRPGKLVPKKNAEKHRRYIDRPGEVPKRRVFLQVAKIVLFLAEFHSFAVWHKLTARHTLVILERSLVDVYIHPERYGLNRWVADFFQWPLTEWYVDLNISLTGDAKIIANRKNELSASEIAALNSRYTAALGRAKNKLLVIDTTREPVAESQVRLASRINQLTGGKNARN